MKLARVLCSLSLAALTSGGPCLHAQANVVENEAAVIYVDAQSGSDSNSGSSASPLKTIQAAVNKANTENQKSVGTKIIVNAGVYRETVAINPVSGQTSASLTIEAATKGTAIISASNLLTGWSSDAQYPGAYVSNWVPAQSTCALPSGWPAVQKIALHTEMLFVNGTPMTQVLAYSDLKPGTFFVNASDGTVHVWPPAGVDPSSATVEVATRTKTISVYGRSNIVLRGLVLEHAASCINTSGATVSSSNNVLIDGIQAYWNNFGGLGISGSTNVTVQNSIASYNGGVGFQGTKDRNALYINNETDYNNWRGAQGAFYNWASGGAKFFQMRTTSVQGHASYNNQAQGLWFDTDNQNITIDNATLVGSYDAALQLERNEGPITLENSHMCSSGVGVNVLTTEGLTVKGNVFYNNGATNKYQAQFYLAGNAGGINITNWQTGQVYNLATTGTVMSGNSFVDGENGQYVFGTYLSGTDWTDFTSTLKSGDNTWYDPNTTNAFHIVNGKNVSLSGWQSATGADYNSTWGPPSTSPESACGVPAPAYADFNVSIDNSAYTMSSGRATATVRVDSFSFGKVDLSMSGLPSGVSASFSVPSLTSGFSTLTLAASSTAFAQTVPVTLWAVSGDRVHSVTFNLTVTPGSSNLISTATSLASSSSSITEGSAVNLTATVKSASGTASPTGTVNFFDGGSSIGTATLSSGTATVSTSSLTAGSHSISASYAGTAAFNGSDSNAVSITVKAANIDTTTVLTSSTTSITANSTITFTAKVQASGTTTPGGSVTFYDGSTAIGTSTLSSGIAKISTSSLPAGTDLISAVYSGVSGFNSSTSNAVSITVNSAVVATSATLVTSSNNIAVNSPVTLTVTVKASSGTAAPTGTVTFYNGSASIGSAALISGKGSITTTSLPAGPVSVSAAYSGAVSFNASTSNVVVITVSPSVPTTVSTSITLTTSAPSVMQDSPLTLFAAVKQASGTTIPPGTVSFYDGSTAVGATVLSSGAASFTTSSLAVGQHSISATYGGAPAFKSSSSNSISIIVNPAPAPTGNRTKTTTTISSSASQADQGYTIALAASVTAAAGSPSGLVEFVIGTQKIGSATLSGGKAYLHTSSLPVGMNAINASYVGDSTFAPSASDAITVKILGPDFTVQSTPSTVTVTRGQSAIVNLVVTPKNGFDQHPEFTCGGLPTGSTCLFAAPAKQADGTAMVEMTIHTTAQTAEESRPATSAALLSMAFLPLLFCISSRHRRQFRAVLMLLIGYVAITLLGAGAIGCGGRAALSSGQSASASDAIDVTINAHTASGLSHTTVVKLVLN